MISKWYTLGQAESKPKHKSKVSSKSAFQIQQQGFCMLGTKSLNNTLHWLWGLWVFTKRWVVIESRCMSSVDKWLWMWQWVCMSVVVMFVSSDASWELEFVVVLFIGCEAVWGMQFDAVDVRNECNMSKYEHKCQ